MIGEVKVEKATHTHARARNGVRGLYSPTLPRVVSQRISRPGALLLLRDAFLQNAQAASRGHHV